MPRGFQVPATAIMEGIIQLHHYVMFYLVVILFFVLSLLVSIFWEFYFSNFFVDLDVSKHRARLLHNLNFTHWAPLEFIWTLIPAFVLIFIAFPSFSLLYAMDEVVAPVATLKVVGHQWYWSYDWTIFQKTYPEFEAFVLRDEQLFSDTWHPFVNFYEYALRRQIDLFAYARMSDWLSLTRLGGRSAIMERFLNAEYLKNSNIQLTTLKFPTQFIWMYTDIGRTLSAEYAALYVADPVEIEGLFYDATGDFARYPIRMLSFRKDWLMDKLVRGQRLLETDAPLLFPIGIPVRVIVTADDVLHSWAVPSFGVKIDCVPGRLNQVHVKVNRFGHFFGQCSELCGVNHAQMPIEIFSVSPHYFSIKQGRLATERYSNFLPVLLENTRSSSHMLELFDLPETTPVTGQAAPSMFFSLSDTSQDSIIANVSKINAKKL